MCRFPAEMALKSSLDPISPNVSEGHTPLRRAEAQPKSLPSTQNPTEMNPKVQQPLPSPAAQRHRTGWKSSLLFYRLRG